MLERTRVLATATVTARSERGTLQLYEHPCSAVTMNGRMVPLTRRELKVLFEIASGNGCFVTTNALVAALWPKNERESARNLLRVIVAKARNKLAAASGDADRQAWIRSARRRGYAVRLD